MALTATQQNDGLKLGVGLFGAPLGNTNFNTYANFILAGGTVAGAYDAILNSPFAQAANLYPAYLTSTQFATRFVNTLVGSTASQANKDAAVAYIAAALDGGMSRGAVAKQIIDALDSVPATDTNWGTAAKTFDNKVTVATYYSIDMAGPATDLGVLQGILANVTSTTDVSTPTAIETVVNNSSGATTGQTFTLTTGADNVVGTSGNDTISGVVGTTFQLTDVIDGGAGTDTMNLIAEIAAADVALPAAAIKNVEVINARVLTSDGVVSNKLTVDASLIPGVTQVWSDRSTEKLAVTNLANGAAVGMRGDGVVTNQNIDYAYQTATAAQTIAIAGGTKAGDITATASTGVTTATITSTGAANKVGTIKLDSAGGNTVTSLTVDAATNLEATLTANDFASTATLTVKGAASSVKLGTAFDGKTIDASGLTAGGVEIALNANTTSFKGGQGNDTVTAAAVGTTTAGAIDAGAGTGDRLINTVAAQIDTAAEGALYTNFEIFRNGAAATQDASLVAGITSVETSASGAGFNKLTAGQAAAVTNLVDNNGATFALATATGTSDVLSVTLANATATASADLTGVTVTGFETMNVVSSSGSSADINSLTFTAAGDLTALNLSGAKPISVSTTNITKAAAISAAGLTYAGSTATDYALTLSGNLVKGSSVTGSGAADSITTTAAITGTSGDFVTYNAGAGNDLISATVAAINNTSGANGSVKIDGGDGTDTLSLTDAAGLTLVDANVQFVTNVEKISYVVANKAINITSGGFFDTNFKTNGVTLDLGDATNAQANTVDLTSFTGKATVTLDATAATTVNQSVTTGSGNDTVTVKAAGTTTGTVTVSTGAGNDTINITAGGITTGQVVVNGGAGQDTITITGLAVTANAAADLKVIVGAGQSTLDAFDSITGVLLSNGTDQGTVLDFDGAAAKNADVAASSVAGYTAAELTYTVTNGILAFAGTSAAALTATQKATLAQQLITAEGATVAFTAGSDSYVFNNAAAGDSLVKLVGVAVLGLDANTAGYIDIA